MLDIRYRKELNDKRKNFLEYLKKVISVNPNKVVHLDKDDLEELLFETNYAIAYDANNWGDSSFKLPGANDDYDLNRIYQSFDDVEKNGILAKFPVWTGDFLKHIDLSEVDFSNVVWDPEVVSELDIIWFYNMDNFSYVTKPVDIPKDIVNDTASEFCVCMAGTNANIDFNTSFESKALKDINIIYQCDFNGVNLSNSNSQSITSIGNCDLRNTGFNINKSNIYAYSSDLRTINLSGIKTTYTDGIAGSEMFDCHFDNCNVANTGLYVISYPESRYGVNNYFDQFIKNIEKGYYDNCKILLDYEFRTLPGYYFGDDEHDNGFGLGLK